MRFLFPPPICEAVGGEKGREGVTKRMVISLELMGNEDASLFSMEERVNMLDTCNIG